VRIAMILSSWFRIQLVLATAKAKADALLIQITVCRTLSSSGPLLSIGSLDPGDLRSGRALHGNHSGEKVHWVSNSCLGLISLGCDHDDIKNDQYCRGHLHRRDHGHGPRLRGSTLRTGPYFPNPQGIMFMPDRRIKCWEIIVPNWKK
jgi:hypothetical protein